MARDRPGLWVEIALTLALITLATILLNAGVYWLLLNHNQEQRRTDLALAVSGALGAQLELEAVRDDPGAGYRRVLAAYQDADIDVGELWVVDRAMVAQAVVAGEAPATPDAGLRAALYGREQFSEVRGSVFDARSVVVTTPIAPRSEPVAALRVAVPLRATGTAGGPLGFILLYTGVSGALIGLFGFILFRRGLIQPVFVLRQATARIAGGDFGEQVEVDAASELQELCDALNAMSSSLAEYRTRTAAQLGQLQQANQELRAAQEMLVRSEKLASVGRLAAGLAHEVGNPLAAVIGYVDLLASDLAADGTGARDDAQRALEADLVQRSRRELGRIHRVIRELLDYARPGSGEVERIDVVGALDEAVGTVRPQPQFRDVALEVQGQPDLPQVRIERDKLHQVLVNLLLNAGDAVQGAELPRVVLSARTVETGVVEIRCVDNGSGFSGEAVRQAFDPFFTTKDVGQGTGLGLATCLHVVEAAGGEISARNATPGPGAVVSVRLPAAVPAAPAP